MHLDDEQGERLLHGELASTEATRVRAHVTRCADCRDRYDSARREEDEVGALLRHLDHPAPRMTAAAVIGRARSNHWSWIKRAAMILMMVSVAGIAWAAPGSPLPSFLAHALERVRGGQAPVAPRAPEVATPAVAGVAVAPGSRLVILFASAQPGSFARVSLTDGQDVVVRAPVGAAAFTSSGDRLVIENSGDSAMFEIEIPRTAPHVEIRIGDTRAFTKEGVRVSANAATQSAGGYVIALVPPKS